jgi:drug/metabolite transporter (DMT)-like permease
MIYLVLSILFSVVTVCFFKLFDTYKVNTFQAIMGNYIMCVGVGNIFGNDTVILTPFWNAPWFYITLLLGLLFIAVFMAIGITAQQMGVSTSMVAAKLSVVVPVVIAVFFYAETLSLFKWMGIALSLVSVWAISYSANGKTAANQTNWQLPLLVFIGSGCIDSLLNYLQRNYIHTYHASDVISTVFLVAFVWGIPAFLIKKEKLNVRSIYWGLLLGVPNYFSMYFLVKTLSVYNASFIFPINNIAIVLGAAIVGKIWFKEVFSIRNIAGVLLAIVSILFIAFA